jgi:hypothetical protein
LQLDSILLREELDRTGKVITLDNCRSAARENSTYTETKGLA